MNKSIQKLVSLSGLFLFVAASIIALGNIKSDSSINKDKLINSENGVELAALESNLVDMTIYSYDGGSKCGEGKCGEGTTKEEPKKESNKEAKTESKKESNKESKSTEKEKSTKKEATKCGAGKCGGGNE